MPVPGDRGNYAEATAQEIDTEVRHILNAAHERARALLGANRDTLDRIARRLLEREVVDGVELREIVREKSGGGSDEGAVISGS